MTFFFKKVLALLKAFATYCPYCLAGKKVVQVASGKNKLKKKNNPTEKEKNLIGGIKMGKYIAIIGVFCPFFWISLLTGASIEMIRFNAIHSGIVILIGFVIMLICRVGLEKIRKESSSSM
ncbi:MULTISPECIES: hypothetical protein [unclassified Dehalobacter]|uniref:hypothetical protein n=1 Tax=unclassified Dehalobacter TaxID=2635733 RepID=UPI00028AA62D|nr:MULTISPECIES: hypothetical protein [unclassified Dehalobacter]AFV01155.1 hypothetical protein DHBDCA_p127 [Dehalobacter sp. DCA]AFV04198.1 hypothetical protein DCF50_p192 [Dehalobacter sp. CF]